MKNLLKIVGVLFLSTMIFSCASLNSPVAATTNPVGELVGQSTGTIYLGIYGNVDAGIQAAAQNGGISEISTVDFEYKMFLGGLMTTFTCTVTGK
ncbi:MAG: hypothetical protein JXR64_04970 [Spirochaetales bacterium]|nr:hypothetical protein [Spirochaetales bacterium]